MISDPRRSTERDQFIDHEVLSKETDEELDNEEEKKEKWKKRRRRAYKILFIHLIFLVGWVFGQYKASPIPFNDSGHALFATKNEHACATILDIASRNGLGSSAAFDAVPSHQVIMNDQKRVIAWFDPGSVPDEFQNAVSLVSSDPVASAKGAVGILLGEGFAAEMDEPIKGMQPGELVRIRTDALVNCCIVIRKHAMAMKKQPAWTKIPALLYK